MWGSMACLNVGIEYRSVNNNKKKLRELIVKERRISNAIGRLSSAQKKLLDPINCPRRGASAKFRAYR